MQELVQVAKAFSDPTRVRIVAALRGGELCVCELCDVLRMTQSTLSTHLRVIRGSGIVSTRKQGKWMYYSILSEKRSGVDSLFCHFGSPEKPAAIQRIDEARLRQRLALRTDGACCVGMRSGIRQAGGGCSS